MPEFSSAVPMSRDTRLIAGLVDCAQHSTAEFVRELLFQHVTSEPAGSPDEIQFLAQTISTLRQILVCEREGALTTGQALQRARSVFVNFEEDIAGLREATRKRMSRKM
jgi:hypothetical protein